MKTSWRDRWLDSGGWATIPNRGFSAQAKDGKGEILIYEQIGLSWWDGSGISAKQFAESLKALGDVTTIDIRINSPGGDVSEADAIYSQLLQCNAKTNVFIDGLAASCASYIAMAGDTIAIAEHGKIMIHNAWGIVLGNAAELRKAADVLGVFDTAIRTIYVKRTGQSDSQIKNLMAEETWFVGQEAADNGFADSVILAKEKPASDLLRKPKDFDYLRRKFDLSVRIA